MSLALSLTIIFILFLVISIMPMQERKTKRLKWYIENTEYDYKKLKSILVLTEEACLICNRSFTAVIKEHIENPKVLCIVSTKDRSEFLDAKQLVVDYETHFQTLRIAKETCAIFLDGTGSIETIVPIKASNIQEELAYISKRLNSL